MLHIVAQTSDLPPLPTRWTRLLQGTLSFAAHAAALVVATVIATDTRGGPPPTQPPKATAPVDVTRIVFIAREAGRIDGGGGGGGNQQAEPIRHAQGIGSDRITLRVRKPVATSATAQIADSVPSIVLDAVPLASGTFDQLGLPVGGVSYGTSTGSGSGGGVGTGVGTGIGSGVGPGMGPGSGGGIGGGPHRPGGAVTAPRALVEVKPTYTTNALFNKVQGSVLLEFIVTREGRPSQIRVVRSLDPELDQQAISAASQWRFEPGRVAGGPVDVLVTLVLDFSIR
jgi:protein TonB